MYIDDGAIVATGANHQSVLQKCTDGFYTVTDWLLQNGLQIDPNKTEFIAFQPRCANPARIGTLWPTIDLCIPSSRTLQVCRLSLVHYLGVFINDKFSWTPHAKIMATQAQSSFQGLLLGNSVCGINFHSWQTVFHAITLLVLLYGLPVWSYRAPKSLIQILQVAQNVAICCISGTFHTTPVEPLHNMLAILPIKFTIAKYHMAYTACISCLPPNAVLRTLSVFDPAALYPCNPPIPTPHSSLLPTSFPVFCIPTGLTWTHTQVHNALVSPKTVAYQAMILQIANNPLPHYTSVFIYPIPHPEHFVMAYLVFSDRTCIKRRFRASHDCTLATTLAAIAGVLSLGPHPGKNTTIFLLNHNLHCPLFSLTKHKYLPQATLFTGALGMHCFLYPHIFVNVLPLPVKLNRKLMRADPCIFASNWPGPHGKDFNLAKLCTESRQ